MKHFSLLFFAVISILLACEPQGEKISKNPSLKLAFSNDTVIFDTLLSARTSITKRFRIFNTNKEAIKITDIRLGKGNSSDYSMIVNGQQGALIEDQVLFGGDSLLILINVDIDPQNENLPYLVKDSIIVEWGKYSAHVKLVAWGQDATFINGDVICDETWTADRPYVIYNYAYVDTLCSLTIDPGTKIFIDNNAALYVRGSLKILGDSGNHVLIRNTRFDKDFKEAPGQWDGIYFLEGSKKNEINYAEIENGTYGLRVGSPDDDSDFDIQVKHSIIRHMSQAGILSFTSDVYASNTLIFDAGTYLVGNFAGGNYQYEYCTFTNSPSYFINKDPSVQFSDNIIVSNNQTLVEDLSVYMSNCIIWGDGDEERLISTGGGAKIDTLFVNNIIRSADSIPGNYTSQKRNFPGFVDPATFNYQLDSLAFARDKGTTGVITTDITGKERDSKPDIGAYERFDKK